MTDTFLFRTQEEKKQENLEIPRQEQRDRSRIDNLLYNNYVYISSISQILMDSIYQSLENALSPLEVKSTIRNAVSKIKSMNSDAINVRRKRDLTSLLNNHSGSLWSIRPSFKDLKELRRNLYNSLIPLLYNAFIFYNTYLIGSKRETTFQNFLS